MKKKMKTSRRRRGEIAINGGATSERGKMKKKKREREMETTSSRAGEREREHYRAFAISIIGLLHLLLAGGKNNLEVCECSQVSNVVFSKPNRQTSQKNSHVISHDVPDALRAEVLNSLSLSLSLTS